MALPNGLSATLAALLAQQQREQRVGDGNTVTENSACAQADRHAKGTAPDNGMIINKAHRV